MQIELFNRKISDTRIELTAAMVDWIEAFYNRRRRHASLGYISPNEYEPGTNNPKLPDSHKPVGGHAIPLAIGAILTPAETVGTEE